MKKEDLSEAMNMLDGEMLRETAAMRDKKQTVKRKFRALKVTAAVIAVAICGTTVLAAVSGGRLVDIKNIFGAITGQVYVDATDDIKVNVLSTTSGINISAEIVDPNKAPYKYLDTIKPMSYTISDENNNILVSSDGEQTTVNLSNDQQKRFEESTEKSYDGWGSINLENSCNFVMINTDSENNVSLMLIDATSEAAEKQVYIIPTDLVGKKLTLNISSFIGEAKADQPLEIKGNWSVDFTVEEAK